jgi:hypothetical protein
MVKKRDCIENKGNAASLKSNVQSMLRGDLHVKSNVVRGIIEASQARRTTALISASSRILTIRDEDADELRL